MMTMIRFVKDDATATERVSKDEQPLAQIAWEKGEREFNAFKSLMLKYLNENILQKTKISQK